MDEKTVVYKVCCDMHSYSLLPYAYDVEYGIGRVAKAHKGKLFAFDNLDSALWFAGPSEEDGVQIFEALATGVKPCVSLCFLSRAPIGEMEERLDAFWSRGEHMHRCFLEGAVLCDTIELVREVWVIAPDEGETNALPGYDS